MFAIICIYTSLPLTKKRKCAIMRIMAVKREFKINDHIVYPLQGVGVIKDISVRKIRGVDTPVYVIYIEVSDMTVIIPVSKADEVGIRGLMSPAAAKKALESISSEYKPLNVDWKIRYQMNVDLVREGSLESVTKVVQGLYLRSKIKELPVQERKLYDSALKLLVDECAFSLKKKPEDIEKEIFMRMEK